MKKSCARDKHLLFDSYYYLINLGPGRSIRKQEAWQKGKTMGQIGVALTLPQ
jgi:hypothetical protein